ncbi:hypothetical protein N7539_008146 [Penicillium diatomitis]|uniref:Uncharacterized protein n=1 Tax=Penicillium diatomitis TaxID=2819901 RepID=A0A9W9WT84_9EURO|nr:uncharacterized protein N7539_008146 [Penicillium diatomitis]KAJ5475080.1 hypothetical protein N7539_008146 [Penicillium diatomitis]
MSDDSSTSPISVPSSENRPRRGSFASLPFSDLFSKPSTSASSQPPASNAQAIPQRRLSITTLGLSGSPTQTSSAFGSRSFRRGSLSSSWSSVPPNDDVVAEESEPASASGGVTPGSPFSRRLSFGAQALREARAGSIGNGRYPPPTSTAPPVVFFFLLYSGSAAVCIHRRSAGGFRLSAPAELSSHGEGFNWTEALRHRAERAPSLGGSSVSPPQVSRQASHQRAASIATMEQPVREMPKQAKQNKPDFFQEKILRGDFMD